MTMARKQRKETDERQTQIAGGGEEGSMQIRDMYSRHQAATALAVLAVDTLKHVGGIRGIMGKWKGVEL